MSDHNTIQVSYYPGCSLESTGKEYGESIEVMCHKLGVELIELKGWTCCGASSAGVLLGHEGATALPALTLKQAAEFDRPLLVPCAACYNRLKVAVRDLKHEPELAAKLQITERELAVKIVNPVDLLRDVVGLDRLREMVTVPQTGLKVAAYYGCLLLRPKDMDTYDDPEQPTSFEEVIAAVGAEPVEWWGKMDCCGAGLAGTMQEAAETLVTRIVRMAQAAGADTAITACQLCHLNLESRQRNLQFPILYVSDLVALALGATPGELGLGRHLIDVRPLLAAREQAAATAEH
jgi:heterodisulfide reductase subunit B